MTKTSRKWLVSLLSLFFLLICAVLSYIMLSTGFLEDILLARKRIILLDQVDEASNKVPPDVIFLLNLSCDL